MDSELDARSRVQHLTKKQEEELAAAKEEIKYEQAQAEKAETDDDKAAGAAKVAAKIKEVDELAAKFKAINIQSAKDDAAKRKAQFVRPSERRRQREQAGGDGDQGDQGGATFSSFGGRRGGRQQAPAGCKLFVGNLSYDATKGDVDQLMAPYGRLTDVFLPTERETGRPRGFAFVTFSSPEEAQAAIAAVDGMDVDGRSLHVNVSDS